MNDATVDSVVRDLSELLQSSAQPAITGSQLGDLVAKHFPAFDLRLATGIETGPGALSRFVGMRLSGVLQLSGKAGADVVYTIRRSGTSAVAATETEELLLLREVVHYAVARMSLDELRRVMIPAGLACEATRHAARHGT